MFFQRLKNYRLYIILTISTTSIFSGLNGQTWIGNGPYHKNIKAITHSPNNQNILYAGAFGWGVFKSTDGGVTWINYRNGLTNAHIRSLLSLSDTVVFAGTNDGVYKTINGGISWTLSLSTVNSIRSIAYDKYSGNVYSASYGSGLFKTTDLGTTWTNITVHDPVTSETMPHLWSVAIYGRDSIYVGGSIADINQGGALFRSRNGGTNWVQLQWPTGIRSSVKSVAISSNKPDSSLIIGTAAQGVYKSTNAGTNWTEINAGATPNPILDLQINSVAFTEKYRYAGTDSLGKFYYRPIGDINNGWLSAAGLPGTQAPINDIDIHSLSKNNVYAATEGRGIYRSIDSGFTWQSSNNGMLGTGGRVLRINGNGNIIAGTDFGDGIWLSSDQTSSWVKTDTLKTSNSITSIEITNDNAVLYASSYGSGVFKSINGGHVWSVTDSTTINKFVRSLAVHPSNSNIVYAGTGNGIYKTVNGGLSWTSSSVGIPSLTSIRSLSLDHNNLNNIYAGSDSSYLFKSTDGGNSWVQITNVNGFLLQDRFIRTITIDNQLSNIIYVGSDSGRIYKSINSGAGWNLHYQLPVTHSVRSILQHPLYRNIFFVGTFGDGIFMSIDSGAHWTTYNTGLPDLEIYSIESDDADPLNLYVGTGSHGIFHTTYQNVNHPPKIDVIGSKVVLPGSLLNFSIFSSDPDGPIPTLSAANLPVGAIFFDSSNGHALFSWNPLQSQIGLYNLTIYASDGILLDSQKVSINVLDTTTSAMLDIPVEVGWNLISVPLNVGDFRKVALFPTANSPAFSYSNSYNLNDTLRIGHGYWLKFPNSNNMSIGGLKVVNDTIDVLPNWNIIGSLYHKIPIGNITPISPVTILTNYFGYSNGSGYARSDTIIPGKGYWVKVNQGGKIILSTPIGGLSKTSEKCLSYSETQSGNVSNMNRISFKNSQGERTLYFSFDNNTEGLERNSIPPNPPAGCFDVRYSTQRFAEIFTKDIQTIPINIVSDESVLNISWDVRDINVRYQINVIDGDNRFHEHKISGKGTTIIDLSNISRIYLSSHQTGDKQIADKFILEQNYPNPFNPATSIGYSIPRSARVQLNIINVAGQVVSTLVDDVQDQGYRTVQWDGQNQPSGVYFVILKAFDLETNQMLTRSSSKMLLIK
ncbi:MAG: T9SS type A sorting domain-containing protein [Ignavibacteriales bacterium]|nr:T9SS type A sorting domain-containing protein [Ignavibacteriales bacterium]